MRGVYLLVVHFSGETTRNVGALGRVHFEQGFWVYVGSAMGTGSTSLEKRLARHFSKNKTIHWHIDYLLDNPDVIEFAVCGEGNRRLECILAQAIAKDPEFENGPRGFGSSDCRAGCTSHIFRHRGTADLQELLLDTLQSLGIHGVIVHNPDDILGKC